MVVFLFSLSLHEAAHAWTAERFGDSTARNLGRITLNPLPHIDPLGTLIFPAIGYFTGGVMFGWAKPVTWNPRNVKDRRTADIWISAAGPISNVLALVGFVILFKLFGLYESAGLTFLGSAVVPLFQMCLIGVQLNVILAVFNMLPIPPLDGSWILPHFLPRIGQAYEQLALRISASARHVAGCVSGGVAARSGSGALHATDMTRIVQTLAHATLFGEAGQQWIARAVTRSSSWPSWARGIDVHSWKDSSTNVRQTVLSGMRPTGAASGARRGLNNGQAAERL